MSRICLRWIALIVFFCAASKGISKQENPQSIRKTVCEIAICGAPPTGPLIEGVAGSIHKGSRHRFHCYPTTPARGFIGSQTTMEPLNMKNQPGVFPAPLMGQESISFHFYAPQPNSSFTPVIIRPDGTIFYGQPMDKKTSPQTLVVTSPAQTGVYTLMIVNDQDTENVARATVKASISTDPQDESTFLLKSFTPSEPEESIELISAEFIYTPI